MYEVSKKMERQRSRERDGSKAKQWRGEIETVRVRGQERKRLREKRMSGEKQDRGEMGRDRKRPGERKRFWGETKAVIQSLRKNRD